MRGSSYFFWEKRESIPFRRLRLHSLLGGGCRRPYQRGATASCGGISQNQHSVSRAPTTVNPPDPHAPHSEYHSEFYFPPQSKIPLPLPGTHLILRRMSLPRSLVLLLTTCAISLLGACGGGGGGGSSS